MAYYEFLTTWRLDAPVERVWAELVHPERWHEWWHGVEAVEQVAAAGPSGVGAQFANRWRSALPYTVSFTTTVIGVNEPHTVELVSRGDLEGSGGWRLEDDGGTSVQFAWNVRTTSPWVNAVSLVAKPLFAWNHDVIMRRGEAGLSRRLTGEPEV